MVFTPHNCSGWFSAQVYLVGCYTAPCVFPFAIATSITPTTKHISDKHTLMTLCVRNGTPFDGVHAPQSLRFGLLLPTPFSFRCGHATSTSHRIKFVYNIFTFATVFVVHAKRHASLWGSRLRIEPFHTTGRVK